MRYLTLATDYDGTLAHDGRVNQTTLDALGRLRQSGRRLNPKAAPEPPKQKGGPIRPPFAILPPDQWISWPSADPRSPVCRLPALIRRAD